MSAAQTMDGPEGPRLEEALHHRFIPAIGSAPHQLNQLTIFDPLLTAVAVRSLCLFVMDYKREAVSKLPTFEENESS